MSVSFEVSTQVGTVVIRATGNDTKDLGKTVEDVLSAIYTLGRAATKVVKEEDQSQNPPPIKEVEDKPTCPDHGTSMEKRVPKSGRGWFWSCNANVSNGMKCSQTRTPRRN